MRLPKAEQVAIFICEDLRVEATGRTSYMGVFGPSYEVPALPVLIPSLCCAVTVLNPVERINSARITVFDADGQQIYSDGLEFGPAPPHERYQQNIGAKIYPVAVSKPGKISFVVTVNGDADVGIQRTLDIRLPNPK